MEWYPVTIANLDMSMLMLDFQTRAAVAVMSPVDLKLTSDLKAAMSTVKTA